jgi:hypothetical protein
MAKQWHIIGVRSELRYRHASRRSHDPTIWRNRRFSRDDTRRQPVGGSKAPFSFTTVHFCLTEPPK